MRTSAICLTFASLLTLSGLSPAFAGTSPGLDTPPINPQTNDPPDTGPTRGDTVSDTDEGSSDSSEEEGQQFRDPTVHVIDAQFECEFQPGNPAFYKLVNIGNEAVPKGSKVIFSKSDGSKWYFVAQWPIYPGEPGWVEVDPQFPGDFDCADIVAQSPGNGA